MSRTAGVKQSDFSTTKGINVIADQTANGMPVAEPQSAGPLELAQRVAKKIRSRGPRGIVGLSKAFKVMDDDNS